MAKLSRRKLVHGATAAALGTLSPAEPAAAETPTALTDADLLAADKLVGRETTASERQLLLGQVTRLRSSMQLVRTSPRAATLPPAFHFNPIVPGTLLPTGKSSTKLAKTPLPGYDGNPESLAFATAAELGRLLREKKLTSTELTQMYLARLKKFGPRLLCVVTLTEELALAQAAQADKELAAGKVRGPLHGVPYGLKDLFATKGIPTTFGAPPFREQVWDQDATVTARLAVAGAVLCAKFTLGELAMGDVWFGGTTRNPWDPRRGSSGSSAGSSSAVAAGLVGFAIGTETYGSIVSPSRECGVTGLRPSFGRISRHGAMPLSWTMDKVGVLARGVEDTALVLAALHGPDGYDDSLVAGVPFVWDPGKKLKGLTVGVDARAFERASAAQKGVLETLKGLGITTKAITLPATDPTYLAIPDLTILTEGAAAFADLAARGGLRELVQQGAGSWPNLFRGGALVPASDYIQAQRVRRQLQLDMAQALSGVDVYVVPAGSQPNLGYTNLTGYPTVVTRCGKSDTGLPLSIEFVGNLFREEAALRLALAYEQATPWHQEWPAVEKLPLTPPPMEQRR